MKLVRDIIVIGAPVGGASALIELANSFPSNLPAAVLVVLHARPDRPILLADALSSPGHMRASDAIDGEPLERNRIYVAADGQHLTLDHDTIHVTENSGESVCCPSIDVLFHSAAAHHKERVVGIVLLHVDEEGSLGLHAIREKGGRTITQWNAQMDQAPVHPESHEPLTHHHLRLNEIGSRIVAYVNGENGVEPAGK